ncbi:MAG: glycosyltransferase family 9 protein [Marinoscillum sp.]
MKVLILRFSSIGDIVLTTPVIRCLKNQQNDCQVHFATKACHEEIIRENPYLDHIHLLEDSLSDLIGKLKNERYDLIIDLHNNLRTRIIKFALGVKSYSFNKLNVEKWLMVNFKINRLPNRHIVDRYMDTLKPLGIKMDELGLDHFIPEKDIVDLQWLPQPYQQYYAAVIIGGKYNTKKLPIKRIIELCDRINKPILLLGGKAESSIGDEVERFFKRSAHETVYDKGLEELGKKAIVYNACGKFNINQSASLIKQASWVFSHDTGLMHIAAAFKKDVFTIWGNTIPEFGMYPYRTKFTIFENKKINCRPCSKLGHSKCPKGHFKCMQELVFDFYIPD